MTVLELIAGFIAALMKFPVFRAFVLQLIVEILTRDQTDPAFRQKFLELTAQLSSAKTADEKRAILVQIKALKRGSPDETI